ncbi:hypothetical protein CURE108131_01820 [Cupriavidus respiraculi]|uniref:Uncharacterized protein n=1 Tax=Cupriavidus respiraculi TaxID=195930 RepID=A0ABM8WF14_9BURK|nr:hypothetical protein LMG21510_00236 [Cupriavidus respiraculi]
MQYLFHPKRVPLKAMREDVVAAVPLMLAR